MGMIDYLYDSLSGLEITAFIQQTLHYFEANGIQLSPMQLSCIVYIAAMDNREELEEVYRLLEEIHFREEGED
jgi:hypothetical protein